MAKATKRQALGRGLSALLKETDNAATDKNAAVIVGTIIDLDLNSIEVNPYQPRTHFDEQALEELSNSIRELGVIQPITVRKTSENRFQLVSGERRFRASKRLGNDTIPAYIRLANDQEMLEMALVENIQRKNLDPIEIALSYQQLVEEINLTQEELSIRVGKKRSTVTNYLRLLKLDPIIQTGIRDGFLSMGHGRALINIENRNEQLEIYKKIILNKLSVRQTEELVKNLKNTDTKKSKKVETPSYVAYGIETISTYLGHQIQVTVGNNGKGKISIPFDSQEDFERIQKLIK
jgi:ParB family chromosome partitioning protein